MNKFFGKEHVYLIIFFSINLFNIHANAQSAASFFVPSDTINKTRVTALSIASASIYGGSMVFLYSAWYKGYRQTGFHFFNDDDEWLQMDKSGHLFNSY